MRKTDNYGARVNIENIMEGEVNEDLLFALLTRLVVKDEVLDMDVMLASRCHEYSGHIMLAEKRLLASPHPYNRHFSFRMIGLSCEAGGMGGVYILLEG